MAHPLVEEFCRAKGALRPDFFRRCQRVFRDEVIPMLHEGQRLAIENAALKTQLADLQDKASKRRAEKVLA